MKKSKKTKKFSSVKKNSQSTHAMKFKIIKIVELKLIGFSKGVLGKKKLNFNLYIFPFLFETFRL